MRANSGFSSHCNGSFWSGVNSLTPYSYGVQVQQRYLLGPTEQEQFPENCQQAMKTVMVMTASEGRVHSTAADSSKIATQTHM